MVGFVFSPTRSLRVESNPDYAKAHFRLSKALEALGKKDESKNALRRAKQLTKKGDGTTKAKKVSSAQNAKTSKPKKKKGRRLFAIWHRREHCR